MEWGTALNPLPACPEPPSVCLPWVPWWALGFGHCPGGPLCPQVLWPVCGGLWGALALGYSSAHPGSSSWVLEDRELGVCGVALGWALP